MFVSAARPRFYSTSSLASLISKIVTPEGQTAFNNRAKLDSHTISNDAKVRSDKFAVGEGARPSATRAFKKGDAAVLVSMVHLDAVESPENEAESIAQPWFLMTHRSYHLRSHRGEICYPGGRIEPDELIDQAALRESFEEINLPTAGVSVWGTLPSILSRNMKNHISATVGVFKSDVLPLLTPRDSEVQSVFLVPLTDLIASRQYTTMKRSTFKYTFPLFFSPNYKLLAATPNAYINPDETVRIWGISAAVTHQALRCLLPDDVYPGSVRDATVLQL
uniref:Nudix hydrolase domain-containing protein n=1 Tax=Panagrellus redivivus TaxID=6233 RepID=A0A7E4UPJ7_PANRE